MSESNRSYTAPQCRREQELTLKKHQRKDMLTYIPARCEVCESTTATDGGRLHKCSRCCMVVYCGVDHQKDDWKRHKVECKKLKSLGLWGCLYDQEAELAKHPLGSQAPQQLTPRPNCQPPGYESAYDFDSDEEENEDDEGRKDNAPNEEERKCLWDNWIAENGLEPGPDDECGICGSKSNLERTECCGQWICNTEEEYEMFSYSRQFCSRSHRRYTMCGAHHTEEHSGDWRVCQQCKTDRSRDGVRPWYSTNGYNYTPGLFADFPPGSMITEECSRCKKRIATGFEGHSFSREGTLCMGCAR